MRTAIALAAMSACTVPPADYDAFNCPVPTSGIPQTATITGVITDALGGPNAVVPNITVTPMPSGMPGKTDRQGMFIATIPTGGMPTFELTGSGFLPTQYVPARPFTGDASISPVVLSDADLQTLGSNVPVGSDSELIFVTAVDCMDEPIYGAVITSSSGEVLFIGSDLHPSSTLTTTIAPVGAAIVLGATGSNVELATSFQNLSNEYPVQLTPGVFIEAHILPQPQ
jgi:hypothetical protein